MIRREDFDVIRIITRNQSSISNQMCIMEFFAKIKNKGVKGVVKIQSIKVI